MITGLILLIIWMLGYIVCFAMIELWWTKSHPTSIACMNHHTMRIGAIFSWIGVLMMFAYHYLLCPKHKFDDEKEI